MIGMGTWSTFDTDEERAPIVSEAIAAGTDLFDSSPMYGRSEEVLARALSGRRDSALVATKIWDQSPREGRRQVERALELFGWVDVYQVHNLVNWRAQLELLEELRSSGDARAIGATHYQVSAFPELAGLMRSGRLDMVQIPYNPRRREAERNLLPLAESLGLGVLVLSPLKHGVLDASPSPAQLAELGVRTWAQAVLRWIASDPRVSCVLVATRTPGRPGENAAAGEPPWLSPEQRELVTTICKAG